MQSEGRIHSVPRIIDQPPGFREYAPTIGHPAGLLTAWHVLEAGAKA